MDQFYISDSKWINLRSVQYINGMIHYDHFNWPRGVEKNHDHRVITWEILVLAL